MTVDDYIWGFRNTYSWMEHVREGPPPLIFSVAIIGGAHVREYDRERIDAKEENRFPGGVNPSISW